MATAPVGGLDELRAQAAEVHDVVTGALTDVQQSIDRITALDPAGSSPAPWPRPRCAGSCAPGWPPARLPAPPPDDGSAPLTPAGSGPSPFYGSD